MVERALSKRKVGGSKPPGGFLNTISVDMVFTHLVYPKTTSLLYTSYPPSQDDPYEA